MIIRQTPNAFKILFTLRGSVIPHIYPQVLLITLLSAIISAVQHWIPSYFSSYSTAPFTLLGIALSLFLGFRNNASYQRWWEARCLWGQLVFDSRSLTRQVLSFIDEESETGRDTQRQIIHLNIAFTHALRHRLRGSSPWEDVDRFVDSKYHDSMRQARNLPEYLLRLMGKQLTYCRRQQLTSDLMIQNMDERMTSMTIVLAACERIHSTPLPFAYILLVHLVCVVIAYTFFGLDALSEEITDPFGVAANHLPLTTISRTIEINLLEALGETELPPDIVPIKGYLQ